MFTTMLRSTGSSLVKAAPWLGFITTPASNYVKDHEPIGLIDGSCSEQPSGLSCLASTVCA